MNRQPKEPICQNGFVGSGPVAPIIRTGARIRTSKLGPNPYPCYPPLLPPRGGGGGRRCHFKLHSVPSYAYTYENAARAVRAVQGQVPTPGYLPPEVPTCLGTQPPEYLPPWVPTLGGWVPREVGMCGVVRVSPSCAVRGGVLYAVGRFS